MKLSLFFIGLFITLTTLGQKKVQKLILADEINLIQINAANCYEVLLKTNIDNEVKVVASIEGEYSKDLDVSFGTNGTTLIISAGFSPNFKNPNDKLSAHKVVSIALNVTLPKWKNIIVHGTNSNVYVSGEFKKLNVVLSDGNSSLSDIIGDIHVKTQSGAIKVSSKAAIIKAKSSYGLVSDNPIPKGNSEFKLETITGNIELSKTE